MRSIGSTYKRISVSRRDYDDFQLPTQPQSDLFLLFFSFTSDNPICIPFLILLYGILDTAHSFFHFRPPLTTNIVTPSLNLPQR